MQRRYGHRDPRGFTLIELMIVVAIVGILAVLAVYGVRNYVAQAKTAEAQNSLGQIAKDAMTAYQREGMSGATLVVKTSSGASQHLCPSASGSVPSSQTSIAGHKYQSRKADWNVDASTNAGFACLLFVMDQPQYYMYSYTIGGAGSASGDSFSATAQGDLNGDGVLSLYQLTGSINSALVLNVAPNMLVVRSTE